MLNAIAGPLVGYLLAQGRRARTGSRSSTKPIPEASWVGGFTPFGDTAGRALRPADRSRSSSASRFCVLLNRTRFGFDLRATGSSETAAVASGVNVKRMIVISMLLSAPSPA